MKGTPGISGGLFQPLLHYLFAILNTAHRCNILPSTARPCVTSHFQVPGPPTEAEETTKQVLRVQPPATSVRLVLWAGAGWPQWWSAHYTGESQHLCMTHICHPCSINCRWGWMQSPQDRWGFRNKQDQNWIFLSSSSYSPGTLEANITMHCLRSLHLAIHIENKQENKPKAIWNIRQYTLKVCWHLVKLVEKKEELIT